MHDDPGTVLIVVSTELLCFGSDSKPMMIPLNVCCNNNKAGIVGLKKSSATAEEQEEVG